MVYFFTRRHESTFCALDVEQPGGPFRITVTGADGVQTVQVFASAADASDRWNEIQSDLLNEGWTGPVGRDPRF